MSLLAERLLLGKAVVSTKVTDLELKLVRETVANAQVFKIDNVAKYVIQRRRVGEATSPADFPELRPPFPDTIFEFSTPEVPQDFTGDWTTAPYTRRIADVLSEKHHASDPAGTVVGWRFVGSGDGHCEMIPGRFVFNHVDPTKCQWFGPPDAAHLMSWGGMAPTFLALSLLSCRNVNIEKHQPPPALVKKHLKRGHRPPDLRWHTLEIGPITTALDRVRTETDCDLKQALHSCRGHFKTYDEKPLFGRVKGRFWWTPHVRGSADHGVVFKDYNVTRTELE